MFARNPENRRRYERISRSYRVWCAIGQTWVGAAGIDISPSGLGIMTPVPMEKVEAEFRAVCEETVLTMRAQSVWKRTGTYKGQVVHRYGLRITGIAADDWDALVRFCNGRPVRVENKAQAELEFARLRPDDVSRIIPKAIQDKMLRLLVAKRRLAPLGDHLPLVHYFYAGQREVDGRALHHVRIHSRICDAYSMETKSFNTSFVFSDDGETIREKE